MSGLLALLLKGTRFIYVLLSLEMFMISMLIFCFPMLSELSFTLVLVFSVTSSVMGLVVLLISVVQYGNENVKF